MNNEAAIARALARGVIARRELEREEGGSLSGLRVSRLLKTTRATVDGRRLDNKLVAWQNGAGHWRYPVWQFCEDFVLPGIAECLKEINSDGMGALIFFLSARYSLEGKRPLDLLREGKIKEALQVARRHGTHGAW